MLRQERATAREGGSTLPFIFATVRMPEPGEVMKLKWTSGVFICTILTGLAFVFISSPIPQKSIPNFERYIQTYHYKIPTSRDGKWKKQLRCLTIPYDSKGRVPSLEGFEGHCEVIEIGDFKHPVTLERDVHIFVIRWPAVMTNGDLELTVLPNFTYLRTSHVNPNPDRFLWYTYISEPQYAALARFFEESIKDGNLSVTEKSEPDTASWTPAYAENFSIDYGENDTWRLGIALWRHFISANVSYLFDQANRHSPQKETWLRFPDWKDYGEQKWESSMRPTCRMNWREGPGSD